MRSKATLCRALIFVAALAVSMSTEAFASSVILNWTDQSSNEEGFKIERMPSGGSYSVMATVGSNVQAFTDDNVAEGASYCYRVSAYNSYGTSSPSDAACAQVPTSSSPTTSTSGGTTSGTSSADTSGGSSGSTGGPSTMMLSWIDGSSNETGFKIERMPAGGSYSLMATVGSNVQAYTDNNVAEGASYCYRVSAYNSYGTSSPSNAACAQVPTSSSGTTGTSSGGTSGADTGSTGGSSTGGSTTPTVSYIGGKWKNYKVSVSLKPQDRGDIGVMFRYHDSGNYYRLVWDADNDRFRLELRAGGVLKVLATRNTKLKAGRFYPIEIDVDAAQITVSLSGRQVLSVTDNTIDQGNIALYSSASPNSGFDNVVVSDLQTGSILLQDDFSSTMLSGWTIIDEAANGPSSWSVSNGALVQKNAIGATNGGDSFGTFALYTKGTWHDYRFTLTTKSMDDDTIGVMFRFKDDLNYYRFSWDNDGAFRRLEKRVNGTFTTLAEDTASYILGRNYQVTVVAQGPKLQVFVDGQLVFSVTDSALEGGTLALYCRWNIGAIFDNVMVEDIKSNTVMLWDDFNDGDAAGWTVFDDEGTESGPSNWAVVNGTLMQNNNIGSNATGKLGTFALY